MELMKEIWLMLKRRYYLFGMEWCLMKMLKHINSDVEWRYWQLRHNRWTQKFYEVM